MQPIKYLFKDDAVIPNNTLPLLLYRNTFDQRGKEAAEWLINRFRENNWSNAWRNGIFNYHHYHSTSHEVLGVCAGTAKLHLGGEKGERVDIKAGDVIVIPAGVGHKNLGSRSDFLVVGAYPNGSNYDTKTGEKGERPEADENIAAVPVPATDPLLGKEGGVPVIWVDQMNGR